MRHLTTTPVLPNRTGATTPGAEVRGLVRWALDRRTEAMRYGWSKLHYPTAVAQMDKLELWLRTNVQPGTESLRAFWDQHEATLRYVMPGTAAGKQRLARMNELMVALRR